MAYIKKNDRTNKDKLKEALKKVRIADNEYHKVIVGNDKTIRKTTIPHMTKDELEDIQRIRYDMANNIPDDECKIVTYVDGYSEIDYNVQGDKGV